MPGAGGPFLMAAHVRTVQVPEADRRVLERRARDKGAPARVVERARIVLLAADEVPGKQIAAMVGCAEGTVVTWRGRYAERGLAGLADLPRSGKPSPLPEALRDRVLELTLTETPDQLGATHWSSRLLADALAGEGTPISHATVARMWHRFGVQPWRAQTFKFSTDPELEGKIRDVVGLYLHPPERAVVLCVDEKPQIQALERTAPTLPVRPRPSRGGQLRLPPARHHHAVRRPGGGHRQSHRGLHRPPPPPGVPGLLAPGGARLSAPRAARRGGQPVHPQASGGACLAAAPSAGAAALHAHLGVLAEPGGGVLLDHHPPGAAPRQLSDRGRPHRRHRALHRRLERPLPALHLDQGPRHRHRQGHRPAAPQDTNDVSYGAVAARLTGATRVASTSCSASRSSSCSRS